MGNKDFGYVLVVLLVLQEWTVLIMQMTLQCTRRGNLASPSVYHGATGNQDFGYTAGGSAGGAISTVTVLTTLMTV